MFFVFCPPNNFNGSSPTKIENAEKRGVSLRNTPSTQFASNTTCNENLTSLASYSDVITSSTLRGRNLL